MVYTISETEQVIITQFGEPVGQPHTDPGLHMKVPFIQTVHVFDKRWLEWSGDPNQIPTRDKKYIWVDTYTRWRIKDPLLFYQRVRDERSAQSRLDDIVDGETRNVIANNDLIEVVRSTDRKFAENEENADVDMGVIAAAGKIEMGRDKITRAILDKSRHIVAEFGIELVDVQVRRVNYVTEVQQKVYERMISERRRIAERREALDEPPFGWDRWLGFGMLFAGCVALESSRLAALPAQLPLAPGGLLGQLLAQPMLAHLGAVGGTLLMLLLTAVGFSLATGLSWLTIFERVGAGLESVVDFGRARWEARRDRRVG
ncbi:MAG: protease modulator HflC, partial [Acidobacteria bacterium]|nr:protease modulator HflC [Acidobacteriota bacterium]